MTLDAESGDAQKLGRVLISLSVTLEGNVYNPEYGVVRLKLCPKSCLQILNRMSKGIQPLCLIKSPDEIN
jgi:hypothetical protein